MSGTCAAAFDVSSDLGVAAYVVTALRQCMDDSARDPGATISRRIRYLIVGAGVHNKRAPVSVKQRARSRRQAYTVGREGDISNPARGNDDVGIVAGVWP